MALEFLITVFETNKSAAAIIWQDKVYSYNWLLKNLGTFRKKLATQRVNPGQVVVLDSDFSPTAVTVFLALIDLGCIIVPLTVGSQRQKQEFMNIASAQVAITLDRQNRLKINRLSHRGEHQLYTQLRTRKHPGLVLFSSGSTGASKAAVHDLSKLLAKFTQPRHPLRAITFLLFDHIGGLNTMFYLLSSGGCLVTVPDRRPSTVLEIIAKHQVELLPTSPTFINLILLSQAYKDYDLSCLKIVSYGTEPMPQSTLNRFHQLFPTVKLVQTYGLSEVGILSSQSKGSHSLWVKLGGPGFKTKVISHVLHLKAESAMLGYLNAPNPFTPDGWFNTGDSVLVKGDYFKILGRHTEMINVGGEKLYPAEVESVIQQLDNVAEVTVYGQPHGFMGQIVCAKVRLIKPENPKVFSRRLKAYCRKHLPRYKVPVKVFVSKEKQHTGRFKKIRRPDVVSLRETRGLAALG